MGAAIVVDPESQSLGIAMERDILGVIACGQDRDGELVGDQLTSDVVLASLEWSLEEAAAAMLRGGFCHLVVVDDPETVGVFSMRDMVRCWSGEGATSELVDPAGCRPAS